MDDMEPSALLEASLGKLPDCVNSVLIQIGKVFRETSQRDTKVTAYVSKAQAQQIIVRANDRFHEALDDVEIQLADGGLTLELTVILPTCKISIGFAYPCIEHLCLKQFCFSIECLRYHVRSSSCRHVIGIDGHLGLSAVLFGQKFMYPVRNRNQIRQISDIVKLKAKAVMERDLALLRAKRAEREKAAGVLRLRASSEDRSVPERDTAKATKAETPDEPSAVDEVKVAVSADMEMVDTAAAEISGPHAEVEIPADRDEAKTRPVEEVKDLSDVTNTIPPTVSKPQVRIPLEGFDVDNLDPNNTTQLSDVDFDSMFADTAAPTNNESLNFDIDFPTETGMSQDLLQDNPFGDLTTNNDFTSTSNENIDSLMPGIENYVNAHTTGTVSDDFAMLDMPATSGVLDSSVSSKPIPDGDIDFTSMDTISGTGGREAAPVESTFDDLFFDDSGDLGMGDGDISGDFGEFDDNWFKSDGQ